MLNCAIEQLTATEILAPVSAADTAAATSAYIDLNGYEGQIGIVLATGLVGTSITYSFLTATDVGGTGEAGVVPISGAPTVITTSNDPNTEIAVFEATQLAGWLKVVGTIVGTAVVVSYTAIGILKYNT
jgi:hypothetical protein